MVVLERLGDADIRQIIVNAINNIMLATPSTLEIHDSLSSQIEPSSSQTIACEPILNCPPLPFPLWPQLTPKVLSSIVSLSSGDARIALSFLDVALASPKHIQESSLISSIRQFASTSYDRTGDSHYDMISALHKSVRGSHGSAVLYWLSRMLNGGEDPMYIARRMVVCASEDVGLADNHALPLVRILDLNYRVYSLTTAVRQ